MDKHHEKINSLYLLLVVNCSIWPNKKIQWASSLEYQFNQYQESTYAGLQALGSPDAFPPGKIHVNAFRLAETAAFGTVKLGYDLPQHIEQIIIIENNDPGRVVQVKLIDEKGFNYIVYQQEAQAVSDRFRTLVLSVPRTDYKVKYVEINLNSIAAPGYSQIDAVGLLDHASVADVRNILSGANYNVQQALSFTAKKENLHQQINSRYAEAKPLVSHDGNTLYFSRLFHPSNTGGKTDPQDIYVSHFINGLWSEAQNVGAPLNDQFANGVCSISPDGKKLLVINGYQADGSIAPGVSISYKTAIGWGEPSSLDISGYENNSEFQDFFLSADEQVLMMAVERHDGYGDQDLYVSIKNGPKSYSRPISLGLGINTTRAEFAPFLSPDNTTLYFASDGHGGYGESDIFKTKRLDETWQSWTKPQNLGPAINTSSWEGYFSITASGDFAYFVSSEGARNGEENIYRIPLIQDIAPTPSVELVAFQGRTFNALTHAPLSADIILEENDKHQAFRARSDDLTGNFLIYLPREQSFEFVVKAPGYITFVENLSFAGTGENEQSYKNIYLMPIAADQVFTLNDLLFERSKPTLLDESYPSLEKLVGIMLENPNLKIELAGHTDGLGSSGPKENLSFRRVEKIKDFLVGFGIDRRRIETIGYGSSRPIAPNDTEENRAKNRRVEVKVLDVGS
ncbi:MAG: OmpA family protein [Cyclobacteriaceae bacterium]|nr:OmpA family protein [Cyclobacteriaceae bacterium]